jgi:hypothetical protein
MTTSVTIRPRFRGAGISYMQDWKSRPPGESGAQNGGGLSEAFHDTPQEECTDPKRFPLRWVSAFGTRAERVMLT